MIEFGDFALGSDANNWIIYQKRVVKKTGEVRWDAIGFYYYLEHALHGLVNDRLRAGQWQDAKALLDAVIGCTAELQAMSRGLGLLAQQVAA